MLPTFNVITCRRCGRSFVAPSPRSSVCDTASGSATGRQTRPGRHGVVSNESPFRLTQR